MILAFEVLWGPGERLLCQCVYESMFLFSPSFFFFWINYLMQRGSTIAKSKLFHTIEEFMQNRRGENLITVIGYRLKLITVIGVAGWPKSPTGSGNRVVG